MASVKKRLSANVPGVFFVDDTCINCGTCRFIAPNTFSDKDKKSRVYFQPETAEETRLALKAVISCPTSSIGTVEKHNLSEATAFNNHCWYNWEEQIKSMKKIAEYSFEWILPGHSLRCHFPKDKMPQKMQECIEWMEKI